MVLNDPFEALPSAYFLADLCLQTNYTRFGSTREQIINYIQSQPINSMWKEIGISIYREYGFISMTETKDNLLMWSHYADQHMGIVIEFDIFNDFFNSTYVKKGRGCVGKLQRVLYRKKRLSSVIDNLLEPYFHKSIEWGYEQEHRLLLSLYAANEFLISKETADSLIKEGNLRKNQLAIFNENYYTTDKRYVGDLSFNKDFMAMFKIPPEAIKSISFGCRVPILKKEEIVKKLCSQNLNNIDLYDAIIDDYDYRLKFEKLDLA